MEQEMARLRAQRSLRHQVHTVADVTFDVEDQVLVLVMQGTANRGLFWRVDKTVRRQCL